MARALTSPRTIVGTGVVAAGAIAFGLPALAIGGVAALAYAIGSIFTVARPKELARVAFPDIGIDLTRLDQVGADQMRAGLSARQSFRQALAGCPPGPFRDRFTDMSDNVDNVIEGLYKLVLRAQSLRTYLNRNPAKVKQAELQRAQATLRGTPKGSPLREQVASQVEAIEEQIGAFQRLAAAHDGAAAKIGATTARIDQLAAQLTEVVLLSDESAADAALPGARHDVARLVDELDSVRLALEEVGQAPLLADREPGRATPEALTE